MRRQGVLMALGVILGALLVGLLQWHADQEQRRAILALPLSERQAMVERSLRNLDALCGSAVLSRTCEEEARLLLLIPECLDACRRRAANLLPHATR